MCAADPDSSPATSVDAGYLNLAGAFVRGRLGEVPGESDRMAAARGAAAGLRLFRFKRNAELGRVRSALGILKGMAPASLLDIGSGRGTFLWPLLDEFPALPVTSVELDAARAGELACVRRGGVERLTVIHGDVTRLGMRNGSVDVATSLEVLEHLDDPAAAARELVRIARRFVVASVPSRPDDNPEHVHLFQPDALEGLFLRAGAAKVTVSGVHGHHIVVVRVE